LEVLREWVAVFVGEVLADQGRSDDLPFPILDEAAADLMVERHLADRPDGQWVGHAKQHDQTERDQDAGGELAAHCPPQCAHQ
jgi:hypothetical protein